MARALAVLVLVWASLLPASRAAAATPDDDPASATGLHCLQRLAVPAVENVIDARWSPDGAKLALVWFGRVPSRRAVSGYHEEELVDILDLGTGALRPVGVGDEPEWSGSGRYLAYWGGSDADEVRIVKGERLVATVFPSVPALRWVGDTLFYVKKDHIEAWTEASTRTVAELPADLVPRYPRDDLYFSGDGDRFTLTRYAQDGTLERWLGVTEGGTLTALDADDATYMEWAPRGKVLLLRYSGRIEVRDLATAAAVSIPVPASAVHAWASDGRTLLVGRVSPTIPGGDAFDEFLVRWPATGQLATLPNVMGMRTFSPDGAHFAGVGRDGRHDLRLEVYRCGPRAAPAEADPETAARRGRIEADGARLVRPAAGYITQFLQGSHTGIDVGAPFGTLITASDDGVVNAIGWVPVGGRRVCVQHAAGLETCYYHTSAPLVAMGERVVRGQPVALIGMTGVTTGPHVHWEAKVFGRIVDPLAR